MSKHNRERRPKWRCLKCGQPWPDLDVVVPAAEPVLKSLPGSKRKVFVHVCAGCKGFHLMEDGSLRRMTPPEEFRMRMNQARTCEVIDRTPCRHDGSTDVFIPPLEELL